MTIQDDPLTRLFTGCCFRVANELGPGCLLVNFGKAKTGPDVESRDGSSIP